MGTPFRPKIDLLLVVDNSSSMAAKQAAPVATFRELLGQLSHENADFDYHIGVVSTDVGSWVSVGRRNASLAIASIELKQRQSDADVLFIRKVPL